MTRRRAARRRPVPSSGVRKLGPRDVSPLVEAGGLFDGPLDRTAARRYLGDPSNHVWLAYLEGRPVGFLRGSALLQVEDRRPQFFLYEIAVDEACRRRGVGRSLVEAMLRFARARGFAEAFVFTSPRNRPAVGLYRSTGGVTETDADRMYVYADLAPRPRRARSK